MIIHNIEILISDRPEREWVEAELWIDNVQLAAINQEQEHLEIEIFPRPDGEPWAIPYEHLMSALDRAKRFLIIGERD